MKGGKMEPLVVVLAVALAVLAALFGRSKKYRPKRWEEEWLEQHQKLYGRYLPHVLEDVIREIPSGEYEDLRQYLKKIQESAYVTAPEVMQPRWAETVEALQLLGDPATAPWKQRIATIMAGTT
ncbi:hypothetical protein HYZ78_01600 [Candidatus Microgenomates bacterium]|nr:hypothetical protein [Candidatus Microgenomates bacterium]